MHNRFKAGAKRMMKAAGIGGEVLQCKREPDWGYRVDLVIMGREFDLRFLKTLALVFDTEHLDLRFSDDAIETLITLRKARVGHA